MAATIDPRIARIEKLAWIPDLAPTSLATPADEPEPVKPPAVDVLALVDRLTAAYRAIEGRTELLSHDPADYSRFDFERDTTPELRRRFTETLADVLTHEPGEYPASGSQIVAAAVTAVNLAKIDDRPETMRQRVKRPDVRDYLRAVASLLRDDEWLPSPSQIEAGKLAIHAGWSERERHRMYKQQRKDAA